MNKLGSIALSTLLGLAACGTEESPEVSGPLEGRFEGSNLLFVSLDTTRADHLGCYGRDVARTPAIDGLARDGVLFERAHTGIPLTLPSHCSMMTGRYPKEHGIRDNGRKALSDSLPTLASVFSSRGYDTGAFVASFVLAARFGVSRGFDTYSDELQAHNPGVDLLHQELPANTVTDRALNWLEKRGEKPFFCWVHYFDAHDPYEPPPGFTGFGDPYDGELAYIDSQLKRILDWLDSSGQRDNTLIVIVGDHGESFGEHGHDGHTVFLYHTNLRVPLIFSHPRLLPRGREVNDLVELVDLYPTLHELFGWAMSEELLSRSLVPAIEGNPLPEQAVYGENEYITSAYGWAQQRSLTTNRWKYISSAKPELYDLNADPGETRNLIDEQPEVARDLQAQLTQRYGAMVPGSAADVEMDAAALAAISKLGYSATGSTTVTDEFLTAGLPDPKEMLPSLEKSRLAKERRARGDLPGAIKLFREAAQLNPNSTLFLYDLAIAYLDSQQPLEAIKALERALASDPRYLPALVSMGEALGSLGRHSESVQQYEAALLLVPNAPEVHAVLANEYRMMGNSEKALANFKKALEFRPEWAQVMIDIALLEEASGRKDEAMKLFARAAKLEPRNVALRLRLAELLLNNGETNAADAEYKSLLAASPADPNAIVGVARYHAKGGRDQRALEILRAGRQSAPTSTSVMSALARLLSTSRDASVRAGTEALTLASEFCRQTGNQNPFLLSSLAAAQAENGQFRQAIATIELALQRARTLPAGPNLDALLQRLQEEGGSYTAGQPLRGGDL